MAEDSGLFVMDADGANPRRLVDGWIGALAWSPDGRRIAYTRPEDVVEIVSADGGAPVRLGLGTYPAWSPDGTAIVAASALDGLVVYDLKTGERRVLDSTRPTYVNPAWSPSGDRIAYAATTGVRYSVHIIPASGGEPRVVTDGWAPTWSPDGTRLAVARSLNEPASIDVVDLQGVAIARVTPTAADERVVWSRSGIAFVELAEQGQHAVSQTLVVADAAGGARRALVGPLSGTLLAEPDWSPDGRRLLFSMMSPGNDLELYRRDPAGGRVRQLTDNAVEDAHAAASPDGLRLAFVRSGAGNAGVSVYLMRADGTGVRRFTTPIRAYDRYPSFSPDGAQIAFERVGAGMFVGAVAGGAPRLVAQGSDPAWSPHGDKLAYVAWARLGAQGGLALVGPNGRRPRLLVGTRRAARAVGATDAQIVSPAWSPDGQQIAFVVQYNPPRYGAAEPELTAVLLVHRSGTGLRVVSREDGTYSIAWSPDGRWLLAGGHRLARIAPDGAPHVVLADDALAWETDPAWLPVCALRGTGRADVLRGTVRGELVCGLGGADRIMGGRGDDRLFGHAGNDSISSAGDGFDVVGCGSGRDVVVADRWDRVGIDCERVTRKRQ